MKIQLVTPAKKNSRNGNRTSALRWAKLLRQQGHQVTVATDYKAQSTDLLIALHAWRSASAINRYRQRYPQGPLIVALGGTDVNSYLKTDAQTTLRSMHAADALVGLHDLIANALPAAMIAKLHIIRQSAQPLAQPRKPRSRYFGICVVGHLRDEKDPLRAALAARLLPDASKIRVAHFGAAHTAEWRQAAERENAENRRYSWKGEVANARIRQEFARTQLMVISSTQEGGANVVSEALSAGVPIIASAIDGNIGLLGADYPGYYPLGDEKALADLLLRAETEPGFLAGLEKHCLRLAPGCYPETESAAWRKVIEDITSPASTASQ